MVSEGSRPDTERQREEGNERDGETKKETETGRD